MLILTGAAVFLWKVSVLGVPMLPRQAQNLWRVEIETHVRGSGRGSVSVHLPSPSSRQILHDEHVVSDGLVFGIRSEADDRLAVWRGALNPPRFLTYGFRVQLRAPDLYLQDAPAPGPAEARVVPVLPVGSEDVARFLDELELDPADAPAGLRVLFAFVADEIELVAGGPDDALLSLASREASAVGKARLLATLLRAGGIPARLAAGLRLSQARTEQELMWVEAWTETDGWLPLFPSEGSMGELPADLLVMCRSCTEVAEASGADAFSVRYRASAERFDAEEMAALMAPASPVFSWLSLYRLPLANQAALRLLLLVPLALLVVAVVRNVVGIPTFGTFMPVLISLSLRDAGLVLGLVMVAAVLMVGTAARLAFDRLHLLFVPRVCVVLCIVILLIVGMALLGYEIESRDLLTGTLFPIVILAMLIERFSVTSAEEGFGRALLLLGNSAAVAVCAYPIFRWTVASHVVFGFPELVLCVMGALVGIGGYTGYRVSELIRFRHFAESPTA